MVRTTIDQCLLKVLALTAGRKGEENQVGRCWLWEKLLRLMVGTKIFLGGAFTTEIIVSSLAQVSAPKRRAPVGDMGPPHIAMDSTN